MRGDSSDGLPADDRELEDAAKIVNPTSQTRKLRTARDLLLPRLMSGEFWVNVTGARLSPGHPECYRLPLFTVVGALICRLKRDSLLTGLLLHGVRRAA